MCYDPFYWYERMLDDEYEMDMLGFDNEEDYYEYREERKAELNE